MKIQPDRCPQCGAEIRGTCDLVHSVAYVAEVEPGVFDYSGESKVCWDSQHTEQNEAGEYLVICQEGHEFWAAIEEADSQA